MMLCLDFTSKKIKIVGVEIEKGKSFTVKVSQEFSLFTDLATFFEEYLKSASADIEEIRVSASLENTFHKIFIIPELKKKMMAEALQAEVAKTFGVEYLYEKQNLGEVLGPGPKVNRKIMTAGIKRNTLEDLSNMFVNSKVKPNIFTTYPAAILALLDRLGLLIEDPMGFLELDYPTSRIIIFKGKEIRLTRELGMVEEEKDPDRSALNLDIFRTLLFYNENYPEERISKLIFAGSSANQQTMDTLTRKTEAEIVPFLPETIFQGIKEMPYIHPGCLGLALLDPFKFSFGFIPSTVKEKRKLKKTIALSSVGLFVVFLICALMVTRYTLDLKNISTYQGGIKGQIKMKEDRLKDMALEFVTHSIQSTEPTWPDFLLEQASVVPNGVALTSMSLKKVNNKWQGEINGTADGGDELRSLILLDEILKNLSQSPFFTGVKMQKKELSGTQADFKITYQLKV
jgi:hypothetical protein